MKILILGAGVIGVTAAYVLGERGHEVEVIERQHEAGRETSYANGGQLSFSHAEPWANPHVLSKVFTWMFQEDAPLVLKPSLDPHMAGWTLSFLRNCLKANSERNALNLLRLGIYSKQVMEKIRVMSGISYNSLREGILHIYSREADFLHAQEQAELQNKMAASDFSMQVFNAEQCLQKEPTLRHADKTIIGGIFCPMDESGDAHLFSRDLAGVCTREFKAQFHYNRTIRSIETNKGRITGIITDKGEMRADAYVMSLGSYSYIYLKQIGITVPIYPMKGYSISLPIGKYHPTVSLTDNETKVVITPLGERLRAAGTAEFAGYNTDLSERRIAPILHATQQLFPHADYSEATLRKWACLRPSTPDGPPIIGTCKYENLFLNTGHGTLGWTQAAGSASLLADIMENRPTEIAMTGLTLDRY